MRVRKHSSVSALLVLALLLVALGGCSQKLQGNSGSVQDMVLTNSVEMAGLSGELAATEGYAKMYSNNEEMDEMLVELIKQNLGQPERAIILYVPENMASKIMEFQDDVNFPNDMSEGVKQEMDRRACFAIPNMLNSSMGSNAIVLSSILSTSCAFAAPDDFKNCYVLLDYGGDYSCISTFYKVDNIATGANYILSMDEKKRNFIDDPAANDLFDNIVSLGFDFEYTIIEREELEKYHK